MQIEFKNKSICFAKLYPQNLSRLFMLITTKFNGMHPMTEVGSRVVGDFVVHAVKIMTGSNQKYICFMVLHTCIHI